MSSQADAASDDERDWSEWGDGDAEEVTKSLFSDSTLPSAQQALDHDAREHGFDLRHFRSQVWFLRPSCAWVSVTAGFPVPKSHYTLCCFDQKGLSDYDTIRCINYIRTEVAAGRLSVEALNGQTSDEHPWQKDQYMHPAIPDDPLLFYDFDEADMELDK